MKFLIESWPPSRRHLIRFNRLGTAYPPPIYPILVLLGRPITATERVDRHCRFNPYLASRDRFCSTR